MNLINKLNSFANSLSKEELDNYKLLLGMGASGIFSRNSSFTPQNLIQENALSTICQCIANVSSSGIIWSGRPNFITDELLENLINESNQKRKTASPYERHMLSRGGKIANNLSLSAELVNFIREKAGNAEATGIASYLYYEKPGCGICPHIDTDIFSINFLIMLKHNYKSSPSNLICYTSNGKIERFLLAPGECILFHAGGTIHGREDIKADEGISILTIGFQFL